MITTTVLITMLLIVLLSFTWVRQPQQGDLARIGGYVESTYGSTSPAARIGFSAPLYSRPGPGEAVYDRFHDVVVFGDSFSYAGGRYNWVSQFAQLTGLDIRVLNHQQRISAQTLPAWRKFPPRLVIFQVVERDAVEYLIRSGRRLRDQQVSAGGSEPPVLAIQGLPEQPRAPMQAKRFAGFDERISVTVDVAWKSLQRILGQNRSELVELPRADPEKRIFSARKQNNLVVIPADLRVAEDKTSMQKALSGFNALQSLTESGGRTRFVLLIVPNRYSVYADHVDQQMRHDVGVAPSLAKLSGMVNLLPVLKSAVDSGVQDVYFPMDTHLSAVGSRIIARALLDWLLQRGFVTTMPVTKS